MKVILTESQVKKIISEIAWEESIFNHIARGSVPMTKNISSILNKEERTRAFHLSGLENIDQMKSVIGTNKTISAFTELSRYSEQFTEMSGIKTNGGVIYELTGNVVLKSNIDIWSQVDENGLRWIPLEKFFPCNESDDLCVIWEELIKKHLTGHRSGVPDISKLRSGGSKIVDEYFKIVENFIRDNKEKISEHLSNQKQGDENVWDEILLNYIEINDIYWSGNAMSFTDYMKRTKNLDGRDDDFYNETYYKEWLGKYDTIFQSMTNGTVYGPESGMTIEKFLLDRGLKKH